jgi:hypothetical protein
VAVVVLVVEALALLVDLVVVLLGWAGLGVLRHLDKDLLAAAQVQVLALVLVEVVLVLLVPILDRLDQLELVVLDYHHLFQEHQ